MKDHFKIDGISLVARKRRVTGWKLEKKVERTKNDCLWFELRKKKKEERRKKGRKIATFASQLCFEFEFASY